MAKLRFKRPIQPLAGAQLKMVESLRAMRSKRSTGPVERIDPHAIR
jgi:hypothetical protein